MPVPNIATLVGPQCGDVDTAEHDAAAEAAGIQANDLTAYESFSARYAEEHPAPLATLEDVVAHLEHLREVAGVDHVGLGGDYDGVDRLPEGLRDVTGYPALLSALADRGWSSADLGKLTSGNILRVLDAADEVAAGLADRAPARARIGA